MIQKPFNQIEKADIDALVTDSVPEGRSLDFKELLPGNSDGDKKELLADVSSFANAAGGDLIFGVTDNNGTAGGAPGLAITDADAEIQRLDSSIRNGIEPRIPGIQIKAIDGFLNGLILIIRIPQSWASPHMVTFKGTSRFFTRNNAGKHQMDVGEIKSAFALSDSIPENIRDFRTERLGHIIAGSTPLPLLGGAKFIAHLVPIESFTNPQTLDMRVAFDNFSALRPFNAESWDRRLNLDGLLTFDLSTERQCLAYTQLYRTGIIEAVDCIHSHGNEETHSTIPMTGYESTLLRELPPFLEFQKQSGILPPITILISLIGVMDYRMQLPGGSLPRGADWNRIDRDSILLPEVMLEDYESDLQSLLRPMFDAAWQSAGFRERPTLN